MFKFGAVSVGWLREIGVETLDDLRRVGVVEAYCRAKANHPREVSFNLLWGLEAALTGVRWNELPPERKAELKDEVSRCT